MNICVMVVTTVLRTPSPLIAMVFSLSLSGYKLVGDVNFDECKEVASLITPVC